MQLVLRDGLEKGEMWILLIFWLQEAIYLMLRGFSWRILGSAVGIRIPTWLDVVVLILLSFVSFLHHDSLAFVVILSGACLTISLVIDVIYYIPGASLIPLACLVIIIYLDGRGIIIVILSAH